MYEKIVKSEGEKGEYLISEDICDISEDEQKTCYAVYFHKTTEPDLEWEPQTVVDTLPEASAYVKEQIKSGWADIRELLERFMESLPNEVQGWTFDYDDANPGVAYVANAAHDFKVTITNND